MTTQTLRRWLGPAALAAAGLAAVPAAAAPWTLEPGSTLMLEGDSTLHAYHSTATKMDLSVEADGGAGALRSGRLQLKLSIPVAELRSGSDGLDKNMRKELKEKDHPAITFELGAYELQDCAPSASSCAVTATGTLSVAGVVREERVEGRVAFDGDAVELSGAKELRMSQFGIKPPRMMMGAIKTDDRVVVRFKLRLKAGA